MEEQEKPIDVLAKNLLLFGLTDKERKDRSRLRYQEPYNALNKVSFCDDLLIVRHHCQHFPFRKIKTESLDSE